MRCLLFYASEKRHTIHISTSAAYGLFRFLRWMILQIHLVLPSSNTKKKKTLLFLCLLKRSGTLKARVLIFSTSFQNPARRLTKSAYISEATWAYRSEER